MWSAPIAGSRRRCPSSPTERGLSTAKSASKSGARGGSRTGAKCPKDFEQLSGSCRPRAAGAFFLSIHARAYAPNLQIAPRRSEGRGRDRGRARTVGDPPLRVVAEGGGRGRDQRPPPGVRG